MNKYTIDFEWLAIIRLDFIKTEEDFQVRVFKILLGCIEETALKYNHIDTLLNFVKNLEFNGESCNYEIMLNGSLGVIAVTEKPYKYGKKPIIKVTLDI